MRLYLKAGGHLARKIQPDVDAHTRALTVEGQPTIGEILDQLGINRGLVAFVVSDDTLRRQDYRPADGEVLTLVPPVSGG